MSVAGSVHRASGRAIYFTLRNKECGTLYDLIIKINSLERWDNKYVADAMLAILNREDRKICNLVFKEVVRDRRSLHRNVASELRKRKYKIKGL